MKPLNFTQLSSKKHKAVRTWFYINCFLMGTLLAISVFLSVQQWQRYAALRSEKKAVLPLASSKISSYKKLQSTSTQEVAQLLKKVQSSLTANTSIESIVITQRTIECRIAADTSKTIADFAQETQLKLVGLEKAPNNKMVGVFTQVL